MNSFDNPLAHQQAVASGHPVAWGVCSHEPHCPDAHGSDRDAAHVIARHPEQGWSLLCNGIVLFEDCGEILPDGHCVHARRAELTAAALHRVA
jgi:hypothetical protein